MAPKPQTLTTSAEKNAAWAKQNAYLQRIKSWQLSGRLGVKTAQDSNSAGVNWKQGTEDYSIYLSGPLGQSVANLKGNSQLVTLKALGRPAVSAENAEQLLLSQLGWSIPVSNLRYWVLGRPLPDQEMLAIFNNYGLVKELNQQGWHIQYPSYEKVDDSHWLPEKIIATYPAKKLRLILLINHWEIHT